MAETCYDLNTAINKYIIKVKSSRKQFIFRPVLDFSKCDIESDLMLNLSNVYRLLFEFYDKSLDCYKIAINDIQDYNKELWIRSLGILKLFPFIKILINFLY